MPRDNGSSVSFSIALIVGRLSAGSSQPMEPKKSHQIKSRSNLSSLMSSTNDFPLTVVMKVPFIVSHGPGTHPHFLVLRFFPYVSE
jgi:hypothetical protein